MRPHERLQRFAATSGWIVALPAFAVVLLSVARSPETNWTVRWGVAAFCALAIATPETALLATTAFIGFGIILSHLAGAPDLRVTEVLVISSLFGYGVRALRRGDPLPGAQAGRMSVPVALFAITVATSVIVSQRIQQLESGYPSEYFEALWQFVSVDYFTRPGDFWQLVSGAVILEGLALSAVCAVLCQTRGEFFERALRMLAVGGAALAVVTLVRLAEIALRSPGLIEHLRSSGALRISPQIPDYIAAGAYFSVCALAALALALTRSRRLAWLAILVLTVTALYLTGSRSPIVAFLAGAAVVVLALLRREVAAIRGLAFAALALVLIASFPWWTGRDFAGELARQSLGIRVELLKTGLRVIEARPVFGVGIDRFHVWAGSHASPELHAVWPGRKNPHNEFLRIAGELGLVGLFLFLWILAAAARPVWRTLRRSRDGLLAGVAGGLVAFLVTCLSSNPLMVRDVSYVFWIALGLAVGRSAAIAPPSAGVAPASSASAALNRFAAWRMPIAVVLVGILAVSIPFRVKQELSVVNLTGVSYGLLDWGRHPDGTPDRRTGPRATVFVDRRARLVVIPLSGSLPSGRPQQVDVRVNGRLANSIAVGSEWQRLRLLLPPDPPPGAHRIDLFVSPTWVPAEVVGNDDTREVGVKIGELKVVRDVE